jgi:hypothetical protein
VCHKHYFRKTGSILVLLLTAAAAYAQNSLSPNGPKPAPTPFQKIPPKNTANTAPFIPGVCPQVQKIGPFLTSDDAELAAQSVSYPLLRTSAVYSQGFPDSEFIPLEYYFDVYILAACN